MTSKPEEIVLNLLLHHACIAAAVLNSTGAVASSRGKAENKEEGIKFLGMLLLCVAMVLQLPVAWSNRMDLCSAKTLLVQGSGVHNASVTSWKSGAFFFFSPMGTDAEWPLHMQFERWGAKASTCRSESCWCLAVGKKWHSCSLKRGDF